MVFEGATAGCGLVAGAAAAPSFPIRLSLKPTNPHVSAKKPTAIPIIMKSIITSPFLTKHPVRNFDSRPPDAEGDKQGERQRPFIDANGFLDAVDSRQ